MNISTKTRYGFRLMIYLGLNHSENGSIQLGEIADKENISFKYLEKIVQMLKRSGLVSVKRGPKGGYRLMRPAENILLLDIYECLEGSSSVIGCVDNDMCDQNSSCTTISLWRGLTDVIKNFFSTQTLADIISEYQDKNHMFYI
ncbi:MAG: hypothetical protein B6229_06325 [Spirochaetaceae bacterium 4572_7]|nr:MAG: hypothetical protein B6229_06325 [Spirochaetaceae bacterium 4572_7]